MRFRSLVFALVMIASSSHAEPRGLADTLGHWFRWNDAGTCVFFDYNEDKMLSTGEECVARSGVVNVKDFGAKGDGVTDDTAEILAAIAAVADSATACFDGSGGTVFLPAGDYLVASAVNVPRCVLLKGEHRTATTLTAAAGFAGSTAVVTLCQEDVALDGIGCAIEGISIDANNVADWAIMSTNAAEGSYVKDFTLRRLDIYGIYLKSRAGTDPGIHKVMIENGEIFFGPNAGANDRGIILESNTFGPSQIGVKNVTITADSTVAGTTAIQLSQSSVNLEAIHVESFEKGVHSNTQKVFMSNVHCTSDVTTCVQLGTSTDGTNTVFGLRADAGVTTTLLDDESSVTITDITVPAYFQSQRVGLSFLPPRGASTSITCAAAFEGTLFYDTNAGAAGTADDGRLCCCGDDAAQGFLYRDCSTPTTELTGASTTDCGT